MGRGVTRVTHIGRGRSFLLQVQSDYRNFLFQIKVSGLDMDQALEVVGHAPSNVVGQREGKEFGLKHPTVCRVDSQQLDQVESRVA